MSAMTTMAAKIAKLYIKLVKINVAQYHVREYRQTSFKVTKGQLIKKVSSGYFRANLET